MSLNLEIPSHLKCIRHYFYPGLQFYVNFVHLILII